MLSLDSTFILLIVLAILGAISQNNSVTIAVLILIILRLTPLPTLLPWIEKKGIFIGVIILTVAVMAPIASGKINMAALLKSFTEWKSILAIAVGILVSWLGGRGVQLMSHEPTIIAGLLIGTLMGVALLKGVPVGPLIAAGLLSLVIGKGGP